jgi:hypothetical protein
MKELWYLLKNAKFWNKALILAQIFSCFTYLIFFNCELLILHSTLLVVLFENVILEHNQRVLEKKNLELSETICELEVPELKRIGRRE